MNTRTTDDIVSALSDLAGCGCCTSTTAASDIFRDSCPTEDGYTSHTYGDGCIGNFEDAVRAAFRIETARTLRELAKDARIRGDVGKEGGVEAWDYLNLYADKIERDRGES